MACSARVAEAGQENIETVHEPEPIQTANTLYYASGGYYAGITLHQLWPVEVEGRASTLVWRGDMISSASVASLRGIERIAAESTMIKDISRTVSFFRRDTGSIR